jgi:DNA-directed RNA polymerase subunit E'/Rpb7
MSMVGVFVKANFYRPKHLSDIHTVKFRLIVFRPFQGEIILGKISSATEQGIKSEIDLIDLNGFSTYVVSDTKISHG